MAQSANKPSPEWVRTTLSEDLADAQRERGIQPETRKIDAVVAEDLRFFEAKKREGEIKPPPGDEAKDRLREQIASRNVKRKVGDNTTYFHRPIAADDPELNTPTRPSDPTTRVAKMQLRLHALCQRDPELGHYMYPAWAREIADEVYSHKLGVGPYRHVAQWEHAPMLQRRLENICDRSNAIIGLGGKLVGELSTPHQDVTFNVTGQSLFLDVPEGRPSSVTSVQVRHWYEGDDQTVQWTVSDQAVDSVNTIFDAASGVSETDPRKLNLNATTGIVKGRTYLATDVERS